MVSGRKAQLNPGKIWSCEPHVHWQIDASLKPQRPPPIDLTSQVGRGRVRTVDVAR